MSVEVYVVITAKNPPSLDFTVEMDEPMPTEPFEQQLWTAALEERVQEELAHVDSYGTGYDGYIAEFINEYAGGYDVEVKG